MVKVITTCHLFYACLSITRQRRVAEGSKSAGSLSVLQWHCTPVWRPIVKLAGEKPLARETRNPISICQIFMQSTSTKLLLLLSFSDVCTFLGTSFNCCTSTLVAVNSVDLHRNERTQVHGYIYKVKWLFEKLSCNFIFRLYLFLIFMPHPHRVWYYATMTVVCLFVRLSLCPEPVPKSKSERRSKLWIGKRDADDMSDPWSILQRSQGQGARLWRHIVSFTSVLPISRQKCRKSTKIVKKIIRIAGDIAHKFERQKVKKVTRPLNSVKENQR